MIAHGHGAVRELVEESGGGLTYSSIDELIAALGRMQGDPELRRELGERGYGAYQRLWTAGPASREVLRRDRRGARAPALACLQQRPRMSRDGALIVTYHAIEEGSSPLCIEPSLFRRHLDCLAELGATTVTVAELAAWLQAGKLPPLAVAITFDDGCASAVRVAAPLLAERGQKATFFCVAGHMGGANDWPTQTTGIPRLELAAADELAELSALGFEIGAHGMDHTPLRGLSDADLDRQIREPRAKLEDAISTDVRCLAYPYGAMPDAAAAQVVADV